MDIGGALLAALDWIVDAGSTVMLPIIFTIFGIALGTKPLKALKAGITVGIGFIGINLVMGLLGDSLGAAAQAMAENLGLNLTIIDIGWPAAAAIAYGTSMGALSIPIAIALNLVLLLFGLTKTLDIDIWNIWHTAFIGSLVIAATGNVTLGLITMVAHLMLIFLLGDIIQPHVEKFYGFKNITFPHGGSLPGYVFALPVNWLLGKIPGIRNIKVDDNTIREKFGIMGDNTMLGSLIGLIIGFAAGYEIRAAMLLAVQTGAIMVILPKMVALLMEGLTPISESASEFIKKRMPGRDIYIGMDTALTVGHPSVLALVLIMIPITMLLAFIVPGNQVLPFGDLAGIPFLICLIVVACDGNTFRAIISASLYVAIGLLIATWASPLITSAAIAANFDLSGYTQVSNLIGGALWTTPLFVFSAEYTGPFGAIAIAAMCLVAMIVRKNKAAKAPVAAESDASDAESAETAESAEAAVSVEEGK
jgi:PTS system galactitol-specific IIC component